MGWVTLKMIAEFLKSFFKTLFYILGFLFLVSDLSKCARGDKPEGQPKRVQITASGNCNLPGVVAESSLYKDKKDGSDYCFLYVVAPSWREIPFLARRSDYFDCEIGLPNILGHKEYHQFLVGNQYLIFPVWQEEPVCRVIMPRHQWEEVTGRRMGS